MNSSSSPQSFRTDYSLLLNRLISDLQTHCDVGNVDMVCYILSQLPLLQGIEIDARGAADEIDAVAMSPQETEKGTVAAVAAVLEAKDGIGRTPLINAARNGNTDIVRALLKAGADVNARSKYGSTALICAALRGHVDTVSELLTSSSNISIDSREDQYGFTALHWSVVNKKLDVAKLLVKAGCGLNVKDSTGRCPIYYAIVSSYCQIRVSYAIILFLTAFFTSYYFVDAIDPTMCTIL